MLVFAVRLGQREHHSGKHRVLSKQRRFSHIKELNRKMIQSAGSKETERIRPAGRL